MRAIQAVPLATQVSPTTGVMSDVEVVAGKLSVCVDGQKRDVANGVIEAKIVDAGKHLIFTQRSGKGFEAEGENLLVFNPRTGKTGLLASESLMMLLDRTQSLRVHGVPTLIVAMQDGGLGADHVAVVNMLRGEVYRAPLSKAEVVDGAQLRVDTFPPEHWEGTPQAPKTVTLDLAQVIKGPVIHVDG